MGRVKTIVAVFGFTPDEAAVGLPHLRAELAERGLLRDARWAGAAGRLMVTVETDDRGPRTSDWHEDEVWDCVIACIRFERV